MFSIVPVAAQRTQLRICRSKTIWAVRFRLLPQSNVHTEMQERLDSPSAIESHHLERLAREQLMVFR